MQKVRAISTSVPESSKSSQNSIVASRNTRNSLSVVEWHIFSNLTLPMVTLIIATQHHMHSIGNKHDMY